MLERCPECSVARESGREKEESDPWVARPCASCGHGKKPGAGPKFAPRESMPSFAGARAKLKTATQDLFRLSGGNSIPVEARSAPEPVVVPAKASEKPAEDTPSSARKPEASIMFSLEELMKANPVSVKEEEAPDQLWNMQAATPLFGTAHDQALLTTPMKKEPSPSMDSMTMPSRPPLARRWLPLGLAIGGACLGVAAAGWWFTGEPQAEPTLAAAVIEAPTMASAVVAPAPPVPVATSTPSSEEQLAAEPPTPPAGDAPTEAAPPEGEAAATPPASSDAPVEAKAKSTKKPAAKAPSSTRKAAAAFDKGAAKAALSAAAAKAAGCGAGGAPGKGKVMLTFAASGKVSSASLIEGPFAGKAAGNCALKHFRAARVPAFSGSAVTVSKSFSIK